jgi:hypothetical protein
MESDDDRDTNENRREDRQNEDRRIEKFMVLVMFRIQKG